MAIVSVFAAGISEANDKESIQCHMSGFKNITNKSNCKNNEETSDHQCAVLNARIDFIGLYFHWIGGSGVSVGKSGDDAGVEDAIAIGTCVDVKACDVRAEVEVMVGVIIEITVGVIEKVAVGSCVWFCTLTFPVAS